MNYFIEGYSDALSGFFDERFKNVKEYIRGWNQACTDYYN